jgi:hypothetical protein
MSKATPESRMSGPRQARGAGCGDRPADRGLGLRVLAADVQEAEARSGRDGGDRHRLDDGERIAFEDDPVLEGAGF